MSLQPAPLSLRSTGRVRRRKRLNLFMELVATIAASVAVAALAWLVISVLLRGLPAFNLDLITTDPKQFGFGEVGGLKSAIVGSAVMVGFATLFAFPAGVLTAVYVHEFAPPSVKRLVGTTLDILTGVPSIVIGIFVFSIVILNTGGRHSGFAGACALAVIELPLIARSATEVLALVPASLREASLALGVSRWRTVASVVVPTAISGILTGTMLAIARAAGETAPLLVTSSILTSYSTRVDPSGALNSLPVTIFNYSEAADPKLHEQAWAASFLLLAFVLLTNVAAKTLLARSRRKLEGG